MFERLQFAQIFNRDWLVDFPSVVLASLTFYDLTLIFTTILITQKQIIE